MAKGILEYFPGTPRPVQKALLLEIERVWDNCDVVACVAPVGSGKSKVAICVAKWAAKKAKRSVIIAPTRILVAQYIADAPSLPKLNAMDAYACEGGAENISCGERRGMAGEFCANCPYIRDVKRAHVVPAMICNPHSMIAHKLRKIGTLIVDEAHGLVGTLRSLAGKRIWRKQHNFPSTVRDYASLLAWLRTYHGTQRNKTLKDLLAQLEGESPERWLVTRTFEDLRGREEECLTLAPVDISAQAESFFRGAEKIVLLSGTLSDHELHDLRLKGRRVVRLESGSAIPAERRPILREFVGSASFHSQTEYLHSIVEWLRDSAPAGKGLVHMPYGWARKLEELLPQEFSRAVWFHDAAGKSEALREWRVAEGEPILIGSGLEEGVDLRGPSFSWQAISKITWPSMEDPCIKALANSRPGWYNWAAVRHCVQASGRVSRAPDDFGATLILDSQFDRLLAESRHLFPKSFLDALVSP